MEVKEKILENTVNFFIKEGCRKVTMDEIAAYNGMSKRTLYENFTDKNDLIKQCVLFSSEKVKNSYVQRLSRVSDIMDILLYAHQNPFSSDLNSLISFLEEVRKYFPDIHRQTYDIVKQSHKEVFVAIIEIGQKEGYFLKEVIPATIAPIVSELMKIVCNSELSQSSEMTRSDLYKRLVIIYFRGISTEMGRDKIDKYLNLNQSNSEHISNHNDDNNL